MSADVQEVSATLPAPGAMVYAFIRGRLLHCMVTGVKRADRMITLFSGDGWYRWEELGPQQADLRAQYELGDEVVD